MYILSVYVTYVCIVYVEMALWIESVRFVIREETQNKLIYKHFVECYLYTLIDTADFPTQYLFFEN